MSRLFIKPAGLILLALLATALLVLKMALAVTPFTPATQPVGYTGQDELTGFDLRSGTEVLFRGQYEREFWGGNLLAYKMDSQATISAVAQAWNGGAAHALDNQGTNRLIVTLNATGTQIPFLWGNLSASQASSLTSGVVDYLRGSRAGEGTTYRRRGESPLGAIVHSRPYYVSDATSPTVFVGANDGMLHAFNALTGDERWAYIPSMLIPKLQSLSDTAFVSDYFVDGSPNVATILSGSKRVLVGALGAGGKGLYALDITGSARLAPTTESAAAANILWEITPSTINNVASTSYANLGFTYSNPTIGKVMVSGASTDVVIVGNGYNNGGDYQAYLYIINANTGALIHAIKAAAPATTGTGSAASPNGLWTPAAVDVDNDGIIDIVYAGDLNGTMWKFNLVPTTPTAAALHTTSPAQAITMTPGIAVHPNGGYMVNFATGKLFSSADTTDNTTVYSVYGIWDGAPAFNTLVQTQTLTERCYTSGTAAPATPCVDRVRTVTNNALDYGTGTVATPRNKGWQVPLPAGERVIGDASFIESGRFYFTSHDPTKSKTIESSSVKGENWLMELDYLTGGSKNLPFLDLSGNHILSNDDRVKNSATPPAPVMTTDGIPVGKFISIGVLSQPVLVQLSSLNNTLFNQNPDVLIVPIVPPTAGGVTGGHFDQDIYYGTSTAGASAVATITIGTTGQASGYPATLGAITVAGVTIVPALTVLDLPNGVASATNATKIKTRVTNGFTASVSGSVVTITAPSGTEFNNKTITVGAGTSDPLVPAIAAASATRPTALINFSGTTANSGTGPDVTVTLTGPASVKLGAAIVRSTAFSLGKNQAADKVAKAVESAVGTSGTIKAYQGGNAITLTCKNAPSTSTCLVDTSTYVNGAVPALGALTAGLAGTLTYTTTAAAGGTTGNSASPQSGWTDFAPAVTVSAFNNAGADPTVSGDPCLGCNAKKHFHQYDDTFDVTGVNMLNPSSDTLDIKNAIPPFSLPFKVVAQNQYLSPAVKLHIGNPSYLPNLDVGYVRLRDYTASATLDLAILQTYVRNPGAVWPGPAVTDAQKLAQPKPIGSLAINMPVDAMTGKDWWGNGDVRSGLHPTQTGCVNRSKGSTDGNMYQPVIPPAAGVEGPGVNGWNASTTPATATGVRHNGALTIQVIRADTPNSAMEMSVPGRPEFGWRVKSANFATYVLAEWTTFWHAITPCYGASGWTRVPPPDFTNFAGSAPAGTTDPKIGDLGVGGVGGITDDSTVSSVNTVVAGLLTTTTINYLDGGKATITKKVNADGTVTITVVDKSGGTSVTTIANREGALLAGGDERGALPKTGRISWRELVAP